MENGSSQIYLIKDGKIKNKKKHYYEGVTD